MSEKEQQEVTSLVVKTLMRFEEEKHEKQNKRPWHKKPLGVIIIGIAINVLAIGVITFFASFNGSQKGLIKIEMRTNHTVEAVKRNEVAIDKVDKKIDKVDFKIDKVNEKVDETDKEWRDAVTKFYKDNPAFRNGTADYINND